MVNATALRALIDLLKAQRTAGDPDLDAAVAAVELSLPADETEKAGN